MPPVILPMVAVEVVTTTVADEEAAVDEVAEDMVVDTMDAVVIPMEKVDIITAVIPMVGTGITTTIDK
jgi:hypothetical protein